MRSIKKLEDYIDVSILDYELGENGYAMFQIQC